MTPEFVLLLAQNSFILIGYVAGPIILTSLVLGLIVALFQAATQVNEAALSFVPKLIGAAVIILALGSMMIGKLMDFTISLYTSIPSVIGS
ncbi:flagellar biosynthetic protein FliQ [Photobacterium leiognathi]|uniref:flagellar biosynthetic protein FliQ n=1 Tax=Photobacterium leiognathi TaxID=553611 RepID=UPI001EDCBFC7|nr:flagellar biosynthetic protein FliQ [Photobacterium leiognathi]MCG3883691.1 flagellar biosynthetic protein FliQ [Photobacterium leiognathi]